jgi:hypothetical protein
MVTVKLLPKHYDEVDKAGSLTVAVVPR